METSIDDEQRTENPRNNMKERREKIYHTYIWQKRKNPSHMTDKKRKEHKQIRILIWIRRGKLLRPHLKKMQVVTSSPDSKDACPEHRKRGKKHITSNMKQDRNKISRVKQRYNTWRKKGKKKNKDVN
jgi:hypothetical protein